MDFIKNNLFIVLMACYGVILFLLYGVNLDRKYRFKQWNNLVLLSILILINFIVLIYFSKVVNYERFYKDTKWYDHILYSIYFVPGIVISIILLLKKSFGKVSFKEKDEKSELKEISPYKRGEKNYYLKSNYLFIKDAVGLLAIVFLILSFVSNYLTIHKLNMYKVSKNIEGVPIVAIFSILGLILLLEIYYYLDGLENTFEEKKRERKKTVEKPEEDIKNFDELYKDYIKVWPANIMASIYKKNENMEESQKVIEENIKNKDVEEVYMNLNKKFNVKPSYLAILEDLFEGKDTIITDANYEEISPFIFSYLEKSIIKGKKILVLAETNLYTNSQNRELMKEWFENCFRTLYKKSIRKIVTFNDWKNQGNWDILIGTQNEIIKYQQDFIEKIQDEQNELKDLVIFVINENLSEIAENIRTLSILSNILNTHFKVDKNEDEGAQYIILSNGTTNLNVAINKNLGISAGEHQINNSIPENFYGLIWKADPNKEYYTEIMDGIPKVELGIASTLSYLAWNHGFKNLNFIEQGNLPYTSYQENVEIAKSYLKDRPVKKENLNDMYRNIIINNPVTSLSKKRDKNIVFIEDKLYNAPVLLKKFSSLGIKEILVNIVSENYLLRDYFIDNIDYFADSPHYGYTPKIESNSYKVAAYLKELLTNIHIQVSEDDIRIELMTLDKNIKNIEEELVKLFYNVYNIDILKRDYLSIDIQRVYSVEKNDFEEKKFYRLSGDISENVNFKWFENFEIIDSGRRIYGVVPYEHVYQNYLKGQVHCFDGKSYMVENIDHTNKKINIVPSERVKRIIYRNDDKIKINNVYSKLKDAFVTIENGEYILEKKTQLASYDVETLGYYEFFGGISLKNQDYKYNSLESLGERFIRKYKNGQILSVTLKTKSFNILNFNQVGTTLSLLFNEIFRTVFPDNYRYVKIFTTVPENFYDVDSNLEYSEEGFTTPSYLSHILPSKLTISKTEYKNIFEENNENQINLYFVEDSHKDIGLIRAISDNFEDILSLIQDYLNWLNDGNIPQKLWSRVKFKNDEKLDYLKYGLENLPKELDIKELRELLNNILGENKFTDARKRYYQKITKDIEREDDFDKEYTYLKSKI